MSVGKGERVRGVGGGQTSPSTRTEPSNSLVLVLSRVVVSSCAVSISTPRNTATEHQRTRSSGVCKCSDEGLYVVYASGLDRHIQKYITYINQVLIYVY